MGLFSRTKKQGDPMSRKKRDTVTEPEQADAQDTQDEADLEGDQVDDPARDPALNPYPSLEPRRDDETEEAYLQRQSDFYGRPEPAEGLGYNERGELVPVPGADEGEAAFKERQAAYARQQLTAAEQRTAALYARKPGESDADYQSRIDEIGVRGQQPAPVDTTYAMPEAPTLADQRAYLLHYNLVATLEDAQALSSEDIDVLITAHTSDLSARREQAAMRGDIQLTADASLEQLRGYAVLKGLATVEQAQRFDLPTLTALVQAPTPAAAAAAANAKSVDLSAIGQPEISDIPFGGDQPRYFVVLEGKNLYLEGVAVTLRETQIINDRSHDIALLQKYGVRLIETVAPPQASGGL